MLQSLHVKNLALIDEAEVEFEKGLNILTGETGAGKSIVVGSMNLALGEKIAKDMVRDESIPALVELVFGVDTPEQEIQLAYWTDYVRTHIPPPYEGIRPVLERFRAEGGLICVSSHSGVENIIVGYWKRRWRRMFRFRGSEKEYFIPSYRRVTVAC